MRKIRTKTADKAEEKGAGFNMCVITYGVEDKQFNIINGKDENVLGGSVPLNHCYINEYGAIQAGEKLPKDLEVGESTRVEFRMCMTKPTIYRIVRIS